MLIFFISFARFCVVYLYKQTDSITPGAIIRLNFTLRYRSLRITVLHGDLRSIVADKWPTEKLYIGYLSPIFGFIYSPLTVCDLQIINLRSVTLN